MGAKRTSRSTRRDRTSEARILERDILILEALGKMRFLTTGQLARLFFGNSRWCANKRLRRLYDVGLVSVWVRSLAEENLYSLNRKGRDAIQRAIGELPGRLWCPAGLDEQMKHLLAINDFRVSLATSLTDEVGEITAWRSDWDLRLQTGARLVPDSLFTIRWASEPPVAHTYCLEVDQNTRHTERFLKKILGYISHRYSPNGLFGHRNYTLLVVMCDPRWLINYRTRLAQIRLDLPLHFASIEDLAVQGPLGTIWTGVYATAAVSLRSISNLPNCKETKGSESDVITDTYQSRESSQRAFFGKVWSEKGDTPSGRGVVSDTEAE